MVDHAHVNHKPVVRIIEPGKVENSSPSHEHDDKGYQPDNGIKNIYG